MSTWQPLNLQEYIHRLEAWLTSNRMSVSASKSSLTLVTSYNREYSLEPRVTLFDSTIPVGLRTKILGVTLDRGLIFRPHESDVTSKAKNMLNVMKALSSMIFGPFQESLMALYRQFV